MTKYKQIIHWPLVDLEPIILIIQLYFDLERTSVNTTWL